MAFEELNPITEKIIGCAYRVGSKLGCRFLTISGVDENNDAPDGMFVEP